MSGWVGIVGFDGGPVDATLLRRLTDALRYRGPDAQAVWTDGAVGFGHAVLATTDAATLETQPLTLDGTTWIAADARIDDRPHLVACLRSHGRSELERAGDAALILHAYHVWRERCVEHLYGDFAFVIWDRSARKVFAARDHLGVKPLYYARIDGGLVLSNTLPCLRLHPNVSSRLNEPAIADFLMFGINQDPSTTAFAHIGKLEPASTLSHTSGSDCVTTRRYWDWPIGRRIRYRRADEYVEHFTHVLTQAVTDRLRTDRVGIWMSGGLDSTAIAAITRHHLPDAATSLAVHTVVYDELFADPERSFAEEAAKALDLDIECIVADDYQPMTGWQCRELLPPEPLDEPFLRMRHDVLRRAASHSRVWLAGDGGDELLRQSYVIDLVTRMPLVELGRDLVRTMARHRCRPGFGLRARVRHWLGTGETVPPFPMWISSAFATRLGLRERWHRVLSTEPVGNHAIRPEAQGRLAMGQWAASFEAYDPGASRTPVEYRTPFLDIRLIDFALALPPLPWCVDKYLLRTAFEGILPSRVRRRPKAPLAADPLGAHLRRAKIDDRMVDLTEELSQYVDTNAVLKELNGCSDDPWLTLRPVWLSHWLRHRER
jgi:asparagine synthase (glutamine-hydrolysing)